MLVTEATATVILASVAVMSAAVAMTTIDVGSSSMLAGTAAETSAATMMQLLHVVAQHLS